MSPLLAVGNIGAQIALAALGELLRAAAALGETGLLELAEQPR
jgi:hypothetical protein